MSSSAAFSPDHHPLSSSEQLCYVHCNFCDTVLAVSVPCSSLFRTVTVRCGHCTNLLSVNMRGLLLPSPNQLQQLGHSFFSPQNLLEEIRSSPSNLFVNPPNPIESLMPIRGVDELPKPPAPNRRIDERVFFNSHFMSFPSSPCYSTYDLYYQKAPEKRQRVPSAYNRFIKEEIQRIKAGNPDISHREAFSAAAKNWAHFPHIHFGLTPDQTVKKLNVCQQEGEDVLMKDGFLAAANLGVSPY